MSRLSRVEGAGFQRWHLLQPGPFPSPGNRPAWCQCGRSPGHSALPRPMKGELDGVEPDALPTLFCLSPWSIPSLQRLLLGQTKDCTCLKLSGARSDIKVREGYPIPGGLQATNYQQRGWLKRWAPGLLLHNHPPALSSVEATGHMWLLST